MQPHVERTSVTSMGTSERFTKTKRQRSDFLREAQIDKIPGFFWRRPWLPKLELFGNDPVMRKPERPELTREIGNKTHLAAQHHCKILQRGNISSDL